MGPGELSRTRTAQTSRIGENPNKAPTAAIPSRQRRTRELTQGLPRSNFRVTSRGFKGSESSVAATVAVDAYSKSYAEFADNVTHTSNFVKQKNPLQHPAKGLTRHLQFASRLRSFPLRAHTTVQRFPSQITPGRRRFNPRTAYRIKFRPFLPERICTIDALCVELVVCKMRDCRMSDRDQQPTYSVFIHIRIESILWWWV